jgi:hypothetical protein
MLKIAKANPENIVNNFIKSLLVIHNPTGFFARFSTST